MGRTPLIRTKTLAYHLYGRANNREWFYLPQQQVWQIFCRYLRSACDELGFGFAAFVLMANHYHFIGWTTNEPVDRVMAWLLKRVSDEVNRRAGRINHLFGGPYKWTLLANSFQYAHALRYVAQNPVRAGICARAEEYRFSSIVGLISTGMHPPITPPHPFQDGAFRLASRSGKSWQEWLNELYDREHVDGMRRALYHRKFAFRGDRNSRRIPAQFRECELTK